jgi:hypothetical protein
MDGKNRNVHNILVGKPQGKRPYGRLRYRWEDNTKMDFNETECEDADWIRRVLVISDAQMSCPNL